MHNANTGLDFHVREFFGAMGASAQVIDLASRINNAVEKGSTAIPADDIIDSPLIGDGASGLLVQDKGLAGFRRHYNQERFILNEFLNPQACVCDLARAKEVVDYVMGLFGACSTELDMQWQGSVGSLLNNRMVITGGPGTGKTTAIVRLVALHHALYPDNVIGFCAPTGKAADKIISSVAQGLAENNLDDKYPELKNIKSMTLHRLLGYNHVSNKFKYNSRNPLPYDLIVVDEASMLDGTMMESILRALKPSTRLVVVGDKDQLPSVGAGNVFEDICSAVQTKGTGIKSVSINDMLANPDSCSYYKLDHNYRFDDDSAIAKICKAALNGDEDLFMDCVKESNEGRVGDAGVIWENPVDFDDKIESLKSWYSRCSVNKSDTFVMLSPYNHGPYGVAELNGLAKSIKYAGNDRFVGMPVMILKNDYAIGVFNGDVGVLGCDDGQWHVELFIDGGKRNVSLDSVQWICASSMSIHKSQGVEYDHVLIALNADRDEDGVLSRKLLYTALSRARKSITIWSDRKSISKVLLKKGERLSFMKSFINNEMC